MKNAECRIGIKLATWFIVCLLLAGCAGSGVEEQGFSMWLDIKTSQSIYGISYDYLVAGEAIGGGTVVNAAGSRMEAGEAVILQFLPEDFPGEEVPGSFRVQVYLVDQRGTRTAVGAPVAVCTAVDEGCRFSLTGSEPEGYRLTRTK